MRLSIIVNNYNYGRFLKACITAVGSQLKDGVELIVVDDGSTDNSLEVLESIGYSFTLRAKQNGGQASSFNEGFKVARGEWIWFIDADDWISDNAVENLLQYLTSDYAKIHFPLQAVDAEGCSLGFTVPGKALSTGNVIPEILLNCGYVWPPTTGNIFNRSALSSFMPIPELEYRLCADLYLCTWVVSKGEVMALNEPLGYYRMHGNNAFHGFRPERAWLKRQYDNLRKSDLLNTALLEALGYNNFRYRFTRRNLEMLILSQRFIDVSSNGKYKDSDIIRQWKENPEVQSLQGFGRVKALIYLRVLQFAPLTLLRGIRKMINY